MFQDGISQVFAAMLLSKQKNVERIRFRCIFDSSSVDHIRHSISLL